MQLHVLCAGSVAAAAMLVLAPALAGPVEDAAEMVEQARAAFSLRDRAGGLKLLRDAVARDPGNATANALLGQDAVAREAFDECATYYERAADAAARDARPAVSWPARLAHLASAMACAAKFTDNLSRFLALQAKKDAAERGAASAGGGGGSAFACERGRLALQRMHATHAIHNRLIDRMVAAAGRNDRGAFCIPSPLLRGNLADRRRSITDAREMLACPGQNAANWDESLKTEAEDLAAAERSLPDWEKECQGVPGAAAANRPAAAAPGAAMPGADAAQEEAFVQQVRQQRDTKQIAAAKATAATATARFPNSLRLWRLSAVLAYETQDNPVAVKAFEKWVELEPSNRSARLSFASLLCEVKRGSEAMAQFDILLASQPNDDDALSSYRLCRYTLGMPPVRQWQPSTPATAAPR